jgi:hypothetical protein
VGQFFFHEDRISWQGLVLYMVGWFVQVYTMFFTLYTSHEFHVPTALFAR